MLDVEDLIDFAFEQSNIIYCRLIEMGVDVTILASDDSISNTKVTNEPEKLARVFLSFLTTTDSSSTFLKSAVAQEVNFLLACHTHQVNLEEYINSDDTDRISKPASILKRLNMRLEKMNTKLVALQSETHQKKSSPSGTIKPN